MRLFWTTMVTIPDGCAAHGPCMSLYWYMFSKPSPPTHLQYVV